MVLWDYGTVGLQGYGVVGLWDCRTAGPWCCGTMGLWVCGSVGLWVCGSVGLWVCGAVDSGTGLPHFRSRDCLTRRLFIGLKDSGIEDYGTTLLQDYRTKVQWSC